MIIFFGISGSGKGTQAEILAKKLNCPIVSTGDILRRNKDNPVIKAATDAGILVGNELLLPLIDEEFKVLGADHKEFILDGTPRNLGQAEWLDSKIRLNGIKLTAIIHLNLTKKDALQRLVSRGRSDDKEEMINKRFMFYNDSVVPAMNFLKKQGYKIVDIDGGKPIEDVALKIEKALG